MFQIRQAIDEKYRQSGLPLIMGILNVTPDSFSDGGCYTGRDAVLRQVEAMLQSGADIIDVGGESTRPGADEVSLEKELSRVLPAIEWIRDAFDTAISIDTYKAEVMRQSVAQGADLINDINALRDEGAVQVAAETGAAVCLMHMLGAPKTMQEAPNYLDVVVEVRDFLLDRVDVCLAAGIAPQQIVLDQGFGFGKTLEHNCTLFKDMEVFTGLDYPLLVGVSRKRMIGDLTGNDRVEDRVAGSVSAALVAANKGAAILRVHDVKETVDALKVSHALQ
ncbi:MULTISPECIES: dihydropteroate synthase [Thiomicrorhabdus]|uniref:Dihydropteroate synthase n=1 Tax=Thiomicrorhabdus heinhorstiae TaxID=2748010 RepID=A0ABS0BU39_9GAMM|nr:MULTISPECIES: dihydropteroate synthase [Thiomicrorhabdus]MBF6057295.1 dihydropteroate synthase [Thiomicrorhabdus heinhorstiae]